MRQMFVVLCFVFTASAAPISIGPIYMSGSGTYSWAYMGGPDVEFYAFGSSGSDSVSLSINEGPDRGGTYWPGLPTVLTIFYIYEWNGAATIDGITGRAVNPPFGNIADWWLGDGGGSISIFDRDPQNGFLAGNLLATASLIGYVGYTNVTKTFSGDGNTLWSVTASFTINPTPEPRSWVLLGLGLAVLARKALTYRYQGNQKPR